MKLKDKIEILTNEKRKYGLDQKVSLCEKIKLFFNFPIQKIIGYIEMANVKIDLSKKVLIPRYETEELIFFCLKIINENNFKNVLDLGCGSGFIGIALKKNNNSLNVTQSDISRKSIIQTKKNMIVNNINNDVIKSDMFSNLKNKKFDVIISNPPYVMKNEKKNIDKSVLWYEPHKAIFAKDKGLYFYKEIEKKYFKYLNNNGLIIFEINPLNTKWFIDNKYSIIKDINNKNRFAYKFYKN